MKNINDIVWFEETWSGTLCKAMVVGMEEKDGRLYYKLKMLTTPGTIHKPEDKLFDSKESCSKFIQNRENLRIIQIKEEIDSAEDLVKYMYNHNVGQCEEYTDWTARKAVAEKAKELLNIDLE